MGITLDRAEAARLGGPAGVPLHASFAYEIAFHLAAFAVIWFWLRHRSLPPGETSSGTSGGTASSGSWWSCRGNEVAWNGLTRPQSFLAVTIPLVVLRIVLQAFLGAYSPVQPSLGE